MILKQVMPEKRVRIGIAQWLGIQQRISKLGSHEVRICSIKFSSTKKCITSLRVIAAHKLYEEYAPSGSTVVLEGHGGIHVDRFEYYLMAHLMDIIMRERLMPLTIVCLNI